MNKWKIAYWCCLTLLVAVTVFSVYSIIDQGVTLTYQKEGYRITAPTRKWGFSASMKVKC
jgi:hypothetical protein